MNIKVSDLRSFAKLSSHIKGSGILPSSNCIKFGGGTIVKNVSSAFVSQNCADSTEEVLVDETVLWPLVNQTYSEFINIVVKGNKTLISDGQEKIQTPLVDMKEFNRLPIPESERVFISRTFLDSLGKASEACVPIAVPANLYMYLHVGYNSICAGNGFMAVHFPIEEELTMVLEKKVGQLLANLNVAEFAQSKSHYFFYGSEMFVGFSKQEIGYFDMKKLLTGGDKVSFSLSSTDLLSFNRLSMSLSVKGSAVVTISDKKIEMYDAVKEISQSRDMEGVKLSEPFSFKPENMNMAILPMDVETLDFYDGKGLYYIKSPDTSATAIIAKISK